MTQNKSELAWNLFVEARKEILEYQKIRTQVIGFKITFVSAGVGLIAANSEKVPPILLVIPAFAAVFFDLLVTSYSFAIKRTGYYCHKHVEPVIRQLYEWPDQYLLWEEFMRQPKTKQGFAFKGNVGITVLAMVPAIYVLLFKSPLAVWLSWLISSILVLFLIYDLRAYRMPRKSFAYGEE